MKQLVLVLIVVLLVFIAPLATNAYPLCASTNYTAWGGNECDVQGSFCNECTDGVRRCETSGSYDYVQGQYVTKCICRCWASTEEWSSCRDECTYQEAYAGGNYRYCMNACDGDYVNDVSFRSPDRPHQTPFGMFLASVQGK
jgi:hypothetical protein